MSVSQSIFALGIELMTPILWAALGELIVEQSGVINIGVEGVMLIAAFTAAIGYAYTGSLYVGLIAALGVGVVSGVVLSLLYVRLGADQVVTGILFNVFAFGLTTTLYQKFLASGVVRTFHDIKIPGLNDIPWVGQVLFEHNFMVYGAVLAAPLIFYVVRRTWFGVYASACGEHPRAVESAGLNVWRIRYAAIVVGCLLAAAGGATLVLTISGGFASGLTSGRGFIALAVVVLARWNPFAVVGGCVLFGVAQALQFQVQNLGPLSHIPSDFVLMLPYAITILAVVFALGSRYPAACGVPFRPSATAT
jgi:general nucleoside transport system permease protein